MSRRAIVEEVSESDSDPEEMDPSQLSPLPPPPSSLSSSSSQQQRRSAASLSSAATGLPPGVVADSGATRAQIKPWATVYPLYFDASRTRAEGRRVSAAKAVRNPLAREIAQCAMEMGLQTALEPGRTHPKDWANPGRVKIRIKGEDAELVKNKRHLYLQIASYLQQHPTTKETPLKLPVQGLRQTKVVPPEVPRGWKMNDILPLHSPGLTGGGVSENMFRDMMAEMQGQGEGAGAGGRGGGMMPGMGGGGMPGMGGRMPDMSALQGMLDSATPGASGGGGGSKKKDKKKR